MNQKEISIGSSFMLFMAAAIWGVAFVAQSVGMDYMGPCTFNGARFLIGGVVLLPFIWYRGRAQKRAAAILKTADSENGRNEASERAGKRELIKGGICCGLALCAASLMQQFGIQYTTVGKAGFITTLYIIIVPVMGIFLHRRIAGRIWGGAAIAVAGMYLLCMSGRFSIGKGDSFMLVCAALFSVHILVIDHYSPLVDCVKLSCIQFLVSGVICTVLAFLTETPSLSALIAGAAPVLYAGVLSCGVAYTLQVIGQKKVEPTVASLLLSLESVVSVLAGWMLLGQRLSRRELLGCALVFAAVILVQLPERTREKSGAVCTAGGESEA